MKGIFCKLTRSTFMKDVNSMNLIAGLTPGVSLNPLKCWTARFTGSGDRLAWLLCESVEGSPTSLEPANTLKRPCRCAYLHFCHGQSLLPKFCTDSFLPIVTDRKGKVMFSQVSICSQSASWLLVHCSAMLSRFVFNFYPKPYEIKKIHGSQKD